MKFSPWISDAVVIGGSAQVPDGPHHDRPGERGAVRAGEPRAVLGLRVALRLRPVQELMARRGGGGEHEVRRAEQVKDFRLIDILLTPEDDELTPTMKLRRGLVERKHKALIDEMY